MKQDPIDVVYDNCSWCGRLRPVTNWCTCPAAMEAQENLRRKDSSFHFRHKRDQTPTPFSLVEGESGEVGPSQDTSAGESRSSSPRAHTTGMSESRSSSDHAQRRMGLRDRLYWSMIRDITARTNVSETQVYAVLQTTEELIDGYRKLMREGSQPVAMYELAETGFTGIKQARPADALTSYIEQFRPPAYEPMTYVFASYSGYLEWVKANDAIAKVRWVSRLQDVYGSRTNDRLVLTPSVANHPARQALVEWAANTNMVLMGADA